MCGPPWRKAEAGADPGIGLSSRGLRASSAVAGLPRACPGLIDGALRGRPQEPHPFLAVFDVQVTCLDGELFEMLERHETGDEARDRPIALVHNPHTCGLDVVRIVLKLAHEARKGLRR